MSIDRRPWMVCYVCMAEVFPIRFAFVWIFTVKVNVGFLSWATFSERTLCFDMNSGCSIFPGINEKAQS